MSSSIFLDSSILVEYYKEAKTDLLEALLEFSEPSVNTLTFINEEGAISASQQESECVLYISQTVISEYLLYCLIYDSGKKSPLTIKESGKIKHLLSQRDHSKFLNLFTFLQDNEQIVILAPELMAKYNLLPNDALILSVCKIYQINALASYDTTDFGFACTAEGISLLQSIADFVAFRKSPG